MRGNALAHGALGQAVSEQGAVAVRVHVDETGSDDQAFGVDAPRAGPLGEHAQRRDPAVANSEVAADGFSPRAIDKRSADNQQIERLFGRSSGLVGRQEHAGGR